MKSLERHGKSLRTSGTFGGIDRNLVELWRTFRTRCWGDRASGRRIHTGSRHTGAERAGEWRRGRGWGWAGAFRLRPSRLGVVCGLVAPMDAKIALEPLHPLEVVTMLASEKLADRDGLA